MYKAQIVAQIVEIKAASRQMERRFPYISRILQNAADAIEQLSNAGSAYGRGWTLGYDAGREESKPRWISVEEVLPSHGDAVLCVGDNGIGVADFVCGDKWSALPWFFVDGEQETGVTHWMPLPEPPKEG